MYPEIRLAFMVALSVLMWVIISAVSIKLLRELKRK